MCVREKDEGEKMSEGETEYREGREEGESESVGK